jgi:hypothetical protein
MYGTADECSTLIFGRSSARKKLLGERYAHFEHFNCNSCHSFVEFNF